VLDRILPPQVVAVETFTDDADAALFPAEEALVAQVVRARRREFVTARACARAALRRLGVPPAPILRGERGAPRWPDGITGSITHCAGFRAAAVARIRDATSLGVDAEPDEPLPDGVLGLIADDRERGRLAGLSSAEPGVAWDRLLFSAKESVYKAWFPLTGRWLDFTDAEVTVGRMPDVFTARLRPASGTPLEEIHGRWLCAQGLIVTAVVVPPGALAG
jgi:4'-phosphopantetheinyl transferase EntD